MERREGVDDVERQEDEAAAAATAAIRGRAPASPSPPDQRLEHERDGQAPSIAAGTTNDDQREREPQRQPAERAPRRRRRHDGPQPLQHGPSGVPVRGRRLDLRAEQHVGELRSIAPSARLAVTTASSSGMPTITIDSAEPDREAGDEEDELADADGEADARYATPVQVRSCRPARTPR